MRFFAGVGSIAMVVLVLGCAGVSDEDMQQLVKDEVAQQLTEILGSDRVIQGPPGSEGPAGKPGPQGPQGSEAPAGQLGPQGPQGPEGPEGKPGSQGPLGSEGPEGRLGPQGSEGKLGPQGPKGSEGKLGPRGPQGDVGVQGPTGEPFMVVERGDGDENQGIVDGIWRVGEDIQPGLYWTETTRCYWARLSGFSGTNNILANDNTSGPSYVRILPADVGFESSRCLAWVRVEE